MTMGLPDNYAISMDGVYYLWMNDCYVHLGDKPSLARYQLCGICGDIHDESYMRHCVDCLCHHLNDDDRCFSCWSQVHGRNSGPYVSIEVGAEDSQDIRRIADGSSWANAGLPGVDTVVGRHRDGRPKLEYRPISNNELSTARSLREYAKRNGLEPVNISNKRAVGGI